MRRTRRAAHLGLLVPMIVLAGLVGGCAQETPQPDATTCVAAPAPGPGAIRATARVEFVHGDRVTTATLNHTAAAEALLGQLPLTLRLRDSFGLAMVGGVPVALDAGNAPAACEFAQGEIAYSVADRAIAVFHAEQPGRLPPPGAVPLGTITGGLAAITTPDGALVTIRRAD